MQWLTHFHGCPVNFTHPVGWGLCLWEGCHGPGPFYEFLFGLPVFFFAGSPWLSPPTSLWDSPHLLKVCLNWARSKMAPTLPPGRLVLSRHPTWFCFSSLINWLHFNWFLSGPPFFVMLLNEVGITLAFFFCQKVTSLVLFCYIYFVCLVQPPQFLLPHIKKPLLICLTNFEINKPFLHSIWTLFINCLLLFNFALIKEGRNSLYVWIWIYLCACVPVVCMHIKQQQFTKRRSRRKGKEGQFSESSRHTIWVWRCAVLDKW